MNFACQIKYPESKVHFLLYGNSGSKIAQEILSFSRDAEELLRGQKRRFLPSKYSSSFVISFDT